MGLTRRDFVRAGLAGAGATGLAGGLLWRLLDEPTPPPLTFRRLDDLDEDDFEVCVVGSGPGGAALALELVRRGVRTVVLESGLPPADPDNSDLRGRLDRYRSVGALAYPLGGTRLRAVGGASNLWTGRCSRLHPVDFEANAYSPGSAGWPLSYGDLAEYYARAETTLRVRGARADSGRAPRSDGYPVDPRPFWDRGSAVEGLSELLEPVGLEVDLSPTSTSALGEGPVRTHRDLLPWFTDHPAGTLVVGAHATRLGMGPAGVEGVEVRGPEGAARTVRADRVVIAAGGVESTRLLLLSLPDAGDRPALGTGFTEHPNVDFHATIPDLRVERFELGRSHGVYDTLKEEGLGAAVLVFQVNPGRADWLRAGATLEMEPVPGNRLRLAPDNPDALDLPGIDLELRFTEADVRTGDRVRGLLRDALARLGATEIRESPISWSHHHLGGCRMGTDPRDSVVDGDLRVHGTDNLFVLSSATFRTGGAAHPTVTIVSLAHRLADHLAGIRREEAPPTAARSAP